MKLNLRRKASIWADVDFALGQLTFAKSLLRRGQLGLADGYIDSAKNETKKIERRLK